jgi:hypothetical protein
MATNNKSLTTYLPDRSVEWLESYCLESKHLQNKEGKPKLGTAIADVIARLVDGELSLPVKIEHPSTSPLQYGTEIETMKGEVEELKKLVTEYGTRNLLNTVPSLETIDTSIETAIEPIKRSVSELETYTRSQFAAVRDKLRTITDRDVETPESLAEPLPQRIAKPVQGKISLEACAPPSGDLENHADEVKTWGEFFKMVGIEALPAADAQQKKNADIRAKQIEMGLKEAKEQGLGEWAVKVAGRSFMRVIPSHTSQ